MAVLERWARTVLLIMTSWLLSRPAWADVAGTPAPPRLEISLIGHAQEDPALFGRIRSLFGADTTAILHEQAELDSGAVLEPVTVDTVYVWITVSRGGKARVYVAAREGGGKSARYLFRDVSLDSGLDEVGSETLAQVAHSSAQALWAHERQTPKRVVVAELQREEPGHTAGPESPPIAAVGSAKPPTEAVSPPRAVSGPPAPRRTAASPLEVSVGAAYGIHLSGDEGLLLEPGAFMALFSQNGLAARLGAAYLLPTEFDAVPARISLEGASTEGRVGWAMGGARAIRAQIDTGLGLVLTRISASAVPPAKPQPSQGQRRAYALAALGIQLRVGPLFLGAHLELRVPFHKTAYDVLVQGQQDTKATSWLSPGLAIEIGVPLTRARDEHRTIQ